MDDSMDFSVDTADVADVDTSCDVDSSESFSDIPEDIPEDIPAMDEPMSDDISLDEMPEEELLEDIPEEDLGDVDPVSDDIQDNLLEDSEEPVEDLVEEPVADTDTSLFDKTEEQPLDEVSFDVPHDEPEELTDTSSADEDEGILDIPHDEPEEDVDDSAADEIEEQPVDETTTEMVEDEATDETADEPGDELPEDISQEVDDSEETVSDDVLENLPEDVEEPAEPDTDETDEAFIEAEETKPDTSFETYDYETAPEKLDDVNPDQTGEFVSASNPYSDRWDDFAQEYADEGASTADWDSVKEVPFAGDAAPDSTESAPINSVSDYMNAHNYELADFDTYSQDPQWRDLMRKEYPDYELPPITQENAYHQLQDYMSEHNYKLEDFDTYSQDPTWRELESAAYPEFELPPLQESPENDYPKYETNLPEPVLETHESDFLGDFETDYLGENKGYFVKGDHYDAFIQDYYKKDALEYNSYEGNNEIITISPSQIEGINLSQHDVEHPESFWGQHITGGTHDSFSSEITKYIPEVQSRLDGGASVAELVHDPKVGQCANLYYNEANMTSVIKCGDYYVISSNGRHRVLAARDLGYDIPVKVIGEYTRK